PVCPWAAQEPSKSKEEASLAVGDGAFRGDCGTRCKGRRSTVLQRSRSLNPAGTLYQPESGLSGIGHAHTTAAPRLGFVSRRVLQPIDRSACSLADPRRYDCGSTKPPAPIERFAP